MSGVTMRPSREEFRALAAGHTVVPVWAEVLGDLETPVAAYLKLVGDGEGFLLESVEHADRRRIPCQRNRLASAGKSNRGRVVLVRQVSQPDRPRASSCEGNQGSGAIIIAQVTGRAFDTSLQSGRVGAGSKHPAVVV